MTKLYAFIGDATHQDSPDSLNQYIVIASDAPEDVAKESQEDSEDATVVTVDRATMDSIAKSIEMNVDTHGMGDGHLLDLTEPYILCWETHDVEWHHENAFN